MISLILAMLVAIASVGVIVALPPLWELRAALGRRSRGLGAILVDNLLLVYVTAALAIVVSTLRRFNAIADEEWVTDALRVAFSLLFAAAPWILIERLWSWRRQQTHNGERLGDTADRVVSGDSQPAPPWDGTERRRQRPD